MVIFEWNSHQNNIRKYSLPVYSKPPWGMTAQNTPGSAEQPPGQMSWEPEGTADGSHTTPRPVRPAPPAAHTSHRPVWDHSSAHNSVHFSLVFWTALGCLQGKNKTKHTKEIGSHWQEAQAANIKACIISDNCKDPIQHEMYTHRRQNNAYINKIDFI